MAEVSAAVIKKTQDTLGKFVKKPQLTEKLLKKPPFRFLHDVVNVVIKDTGFLRGLYKPEELVSDNVKERDAKIAFLQKLIEVTGIATKKQISAKPSKIVAGQEAEKTNELLQIIGMAIQSKVDTKKAIEEWRSRQQQPPQANGKPAAKAKKSLTKAPSKEAISDKKIKEAIQSALIESKGAEDGEKKPRVDSGIVEDTGPQPEESSPKVEDQPLSPKSVGPVERKSSLENATDDKPSPKSPNISPPPSNSIPSNAPVDDQQELINVIDEEANRRKKKPPPTVRKSSKDNLLKQDSQDNSQPPPPPAVNGKPPSATSKALKSTPNPLKKASSVDVGKNETSLETTTAKASHPPVVRPRTSLRPPSARPASARPGAPRKRDRHVEVVVQSNENIQLGDINVKVEQFKSNAATTIQGKVGTGTTTAIDDADDDNLIIIEDMNVQETLQKHAELEREEAVGGTSTSHLGDDNHGQLVKQILDSQKEFESTGGGDSKVPDKGGNSVLNDLRNQVQRLTKSIQPLGKFMDFLLEDIDSMQREYEVWSERGKEVALRLARERNTQEGTVVSLRHQLEELEYEVQEKESQLMTVRENLLQNEEKILKLFRGL